MAPEDEEALDRELPELGPLSRACSCPMCYDLLKGPVVLPCGHAFCSACIRHNFDFKLAQNQAPICPICRMACDPSELRPCLPLREAAAAMGKLPAAITRLLAAARELCQAPAVTEAPAGTEASSQPDISAQQQGRGAKRKASAQPGAPRAVKQAAPARGAPVVGSVQPRPAPGAQAAAQGAGPRRTVAPRRPSHTHSYSIELLSSSDESGVAGGASEAAAAERPISSHSGGGGGDEADSSAGGGGRSSEQGTHDAGTHTGHAAGSRGWHTPTPAPAPAQAAPRPGYVACPICGISTRAAFVNAHLDICISRQGQQENVQPSGRGLQPATQKPITNKPKALPAATQQRAGGRDATAHKPGASAAAALPKAPAIDVPPKLVFNLISDKDLRKRMQTLGLPLDGKKQDWVDRYQAYRRFLQSKIDEGTRSTQAQLRNSFLNQQRQQAEARRVAPRLSEGGAFPVAAHSAPTAAFKHSDLIDQAKARMQALKAAQAAGGAGTAAGLQQTAAAVRAQGSGQGELKGGQGSGDVRGVAAGNGGQAGAPVVEGRHSGGVGGTDMSRDVSDGDVLETEGHDREGAEHMDEGLGESQGGEPAGAEAAEGGQDVAVRQQVEEAQWQEEGPEQPTGGPGQVDQGYDDAGMEHPWQGEAQWHEEGPEQPTGLGQVAQEDGDAGAAHPWQQDGAWPATWDVVEGDDDCLEEGEASGDFVCE